MIDFLNGYDENMSDHFEGKLSMVKAHCVVITAQDDMNFIVVVVCERIMELQPSKKMNLMMMMKES